LPNPWLTRSPTLLWRFSVNPFCYWKKQSKKSGKAGQIAQLPLRCNMGIGPGGGKGAGAKRR
jgi:hypothetical protein